MATTVSEQPLNVVLVGVAAVGKTCLLEAYTKNWTPWREYIPTLKASMQHSTRLSIGNTTRTVRIWDTRDLNSWDTIGLPSYDAHGHEEYDDGCKETVSKADVLILAFSISSPSSLTSLEQNFPVLRALAPSAESVVVGLKADLRNSEEVHRMLEERGLDFVSREEGEQFAKDVGAAKYLECGSSSQEEARKVLESVFGLSTEKQSRISSVLSKLK